MVFPDLLNVWQHAKLSDASVADEDVKKPNNQLRCLTNHDLIGQADKHIIFLKITIAKGDVRHLWMLFFFL